MITIIFYDFEVFKYDWLVVILDMDARQEHVIINDPDQLKAFYELHKNDIWVGYNSRNYEDSATLYMGYPVGILNGLDLYRKARC